MSDKNIEKEDDFSFFKENKKPSKCLCGELDKIKLKNDDEFRDSLIITVDVDGVPCNLLVDTGSVINILSLPFAKKANMEDKNIVHVKNLVGLTDKEDQFQEAVGVECKLSLCNLELDKIIFNVSPEIHKIFEYAYNGKVDGIIGHETLEKINAIISYKDGFLYYSK